MLQVSKNYLLVLVALLTLLPCQQTTAREWPKLDQATANAEWQHPQIDDDNLQEWMRFVWPTEQDLEWRKVRWHVELADAQEEARELQRPILLWTMNGHPCGET